MNEDEAFYEETHGGSVGFDYQAVDPDDVMAVYRRAAAFMEGILSNSRTVEAARIRLAVASWIFNGKQETVTSLADRLKVSRARVHQVSDELTDDFLRK